MCCLLQAVTSGDVLQIYKFLVSFGNSYIADCHITCSNLTTGVNSEESQHRHQENIN